MSVLRSTIEQLAAEFAGNVIAALRGASIEELYALSGTTDKRPVSRARDAAPRTPSGRLGRRSTDDIERMIDAIHALLQKSPQGLRSEQIRDALHCEAKELPRPLADGIAQGRFTKTGQKRATTYFAGNGEAGGAKRRRRGRRKR